MATPYPATVVGELEGLSPEEIGRLEKRRRDVKNYQPPKWRSNCVDDVSGEVIEQPMVEHASIHPLCVPSEGYKYIIKAAILVYCIASQNKIEVVLLCAY